MVVGRLSDHRKYATWAKQHDRLTEADRERIRTQIEMLVFRPRISILMPTYNTPEALLRAAIESVLAQLYPDWELCIADDASSREHVREILDRYATRDPRVKVTYRDTTGHISAATNSALALASGEYVSLIDHDDLIPEHALFELVRQLNADPTLDMVYSDEDKVDTQGRRYDPFFKPDWSPDYLESCMYTAHLALYRKAIVERLGGFRTGYDGAQDYDFVLRFTEQTDCIAHVPKVLYHWRAIPGSTATSMYSKDYAVASGIRALKDRLARTGRVGSVRGNAYPGCFDVRVQLPVTPLVSIVIPTAGRERIVRGTRLNLVSNCVRSLVAKTTYPSYEIIVVEDGDLRAEVRDVLLGHGCRLVTFREAEFNFSKKLNLGASTARGEYLLFLNDDVSVIEGDWINALLEQGIKSGVGVVGAKLLYEDGSIQHAGVVHREGLPDHVRKHYPRSDPGYMFSTVSVKNYLAVTAACMLTPAHVFHEVGGFTEAFKINYGDVDYCLKVRQLGYRTVYTPHAELYHFESASRVVAKVASEEVALYLERWREISRRDPYYNADYLETSPPDFTFRVFAGRTGSSVDAKLSNRA
jgi:glycosyltransferase involved in cell wall biosynthesis